MTFMNVPEGMNLLNFVTIQLGMRRYFYAFCECPLVLWFIGWVESTTI